MVSVHYLDDMIRAQNRCETRGIVSICSANPFVIEASIQHALRVDSPVLIESTCNQVNQFGGYTGLTPEQFVAYVEAIAEKLDFPRERLLLGGDHLGPYPWRAEPLQLAMQKSQELVQDYVQAGYVKIHLDASMKCADDNPERPLHKSAAAKRAATMASVAEQTYQEMGGLGTAPRYVIGTEVPVPGGIEDSNEQLKVTTVQDVKEMIEITGNEFVKQGLESAWERVVAVVVQPGVDYGDESILSYDRGKAAELSSFIENYPNLVYEAHSTDYQTLQALKELVEDHFGILKVGPALTFAFREAVFALAMMEDELLTGERAKDRSNLRAVLEEAMIENPTHWQNYYAGDDDDQKFARKYSFSDRSRYYWPDTKVKASLQTLLKNIGSCPLPASMVSQFLPMQYERIISGELICTPHHIIMDKICSVLDGYSDAAYG
ncbi:MAG: class II D-tagatose-bisphosphate aldolase, non-catalytic subunit [Anaerolineales bacterium]|nr:class II D-tagatose-bisphosphate aldolase, non-catalytic subunit [Anaerolineales bacterium]